MSKSVKEVNKQGRMASNVNIDAKPAPGDAFTVIDNSNNKILMKVSIGCRRDTNPEIDGALQDMWAKAKGEGQLQLCRYDGLSEPFFIAKLGKKGSFIPVTFLVGPHHEKCLGYEGLPTESAMKKALRDGAALRYEWTGEDLLHTIAAGKEVFDLNAEGAAVQISMTVAEAKAKIKAKVERRVQAAELRAEIKAGTVAPAKVAVVAPAKPAKVAKAKPAVVAPAKPAKAKAKKKSVVAEAKESGAIKKVAKKKQIWYQMINGKIAKKRMVKQPEGFFGSEKEAKLHRVVAE